MRLLRRALNVVGLCACVGLAHAQNMIEMSLVGQPLQYLKDGSVSGCGVRVVGFVPTREERVPREAVDVSFNIFLPFDGMVKGIYMHGQVAGPTGAAPPPR